MKYRYRWIGIFLLGAAAVAFAATPMDTPSGFTSCFVQTRTLPGFDQPLVSHGMMRFSPAEGFHWEITRPYHYVFDMSHGQAHEELPDGTWRALKPGKTPWLKTVQRLFISALSGDQARLERYFTVTIKPLDQGRRVTLVPRSGAMAEVITRIKVTESAPGHPRHLVIDEESGAHMDVRFMPCDADAGR